MAPVHRTQHQEDGGSDDARVQHVRDAAGGVNNGRRTGQPRPFKRVRAACLRCLPLLGSLCWGCQKLVQARGPAQRTPRAP
jgi:hypothetical protein